MGDHAFAGYPAPFAFEGPSTRSKKTEQLIWGDYVTLLAPPVKGWQQVRARGSTGWMQTKAMPGAGALGAFGKYARGERPLIFSTELARSSKDSIRNPNALRTDGQRVLLARKLEAPAPDGRKWDVHCLEPDAAGTLRYVSKHTD